MKILKTIGSTLQVYSLFVGWLFVNLVMIYDYHDRVTNPPTGFIPSSYHPPNAILLGIVLAIMGLELLFIYGILRPWKRQHRRLRVVFLLILNFLWTFFSGLMSGTRPPSPLIWHFGWLLLVEIILLVDVAIFCLVSSLHYVWRSTSRH